MAGWNGSSGGSTAAPKKPIKSKQRLAIGKGALAGVIVVALAALVALMLLPRERQAEKAEEVPKTKKIVEAVPAAVPTNATPVEASVGEEPVFKDGRTSEWSKKFSKDSTWNATTNSFGQQVEIVWDGGKMHKRISYSKPPMFNNASDEALAMATAPGGGMMAPIPIAPNAEKRFRESLKQEIVINDDDPYEVKLRKADVINAREEMKRLLDAGESFASVINRTVEENNASYSIRQEARSSVLNMLQDDPEGATQLMEKYNQVLRKNGIAELTAEDFEIRKPRKN